jgi:replicative DNA helicase
VARAICGARLAARRVVGEVVLDQELTQARGPSPGGAPSSPGAAGGGRRSAAASSAADAGAREVTLRAIPADHDAERAVLAAVMLDHETLDKVADKLAPASFDLPRHRILYESFLALAERRQAITLLSLRAYLREQDLLDKVGGVAFLAEVADAAVTAAHIETHAEILHERAIARALIRTCEDVAARGYRGHDSSQALLEHAEREVLAIAMGHTRGGFSDMETNLPDALRYIQRVQDGEVTGISTGFVDLDKMTGGFEGGDLIILAARPSMGKTALALNIARNHALDMGGCVAVFSLEMTARQLVLRMLMGEARCDLSRFRQGFLGQSDMDRLARASEALERARVFIDDSGAVTMSDIAAKSRRLDREQRVSLIVVDYIQLIQSRASAGSRREQEVAEISRSLKLLAKEIDVPILALSQLNRGPELRPNKRPHLADLRESGAIEQDADRVMFIYRDEVYDPESPDVGIAEIIIGKQRNGPTGTVKLQFEGRHARFGNLATQDDPPDAGFGSEPPL